MCRSLERKITCVEYTYHMCIIYDGDADEMLFGPLKAKGIDLLMEKEVRVEKHRDLQLPDHDAYYDAHVGDDGDGGGHSDDAHGGDENGGESPLVMQVLMKRTKHLVIEGKMKWEMDFEDGTTVAFQGLTY